MSDRENENHRGARGPLPDRSPLPNVEAVDLYAELEAKRDELALTNRALAEVNACSAELVAELEERTEALRLANEKLTHANATSARLVAELQARGEELEWANTNLRRADEERKRILGVAAHDLRSGIAGIFNLARLLERGESDAASDSASSIALVRGESERLLSLLAGILEEARTDAGRLEIQPAQTDLGRIVREAIRFQEGPAHAKDQLLVAELPEKAGSIEADSLRLRQVLDNLVSNAVKYAPQSTRIVVRMWESERETGVSVLDEGPGLTDDDLDKVFGEFCRLSAKPTGGEESHGLGLAIAKRIVEAHGGRIWAENRTERTGAHFGFCVPRAIGEGAALSILVVDDGVINRSIAKKFLEKDGHSVDLATDGREAIERIARSKYDIVFMDVEMPGMGGIEAVREIRNGEAPDARLPIVALTGHADKGNRDECLRAGMDDVVVKPFDPRTLRLAVSRWARRDERSIPE